MSSLWGEEQEQAFTDLKKYLSSPLILSSPLLGEDLLMYLALSGVAVSAVLFQKEQGKKTSIIY